MKGALGTECTSCSVNIRALLLPQIEKGQAFWKDLQILQQYLFAPQSQPHPQRSHSNEWTLSCDMPQSLTYVRPSSKLQWTQGHGLLTDHQLQS